MEAEVEAEVPETEVMLPPQESSFAITFSFGDNNAWFTFESTVVSEDETEISLDMSSLDDIWADLTKEINSIDDWSSLDSNDWDSLIQMQYLQDEEIDELFRPGQTGRKQGKGKNGRGGKRGGRRGNRNGPGKQERPNRGTKEHNRRHKKPYTAPEDDLLNFDATFQWIMDNEDAIMRDFDSIDGVEELRSEMMSEAIGEAEESTRDGSESDSDSDSFSDSNSESDSDSFDEFVA